MRPALFRQNARFGAIRTAPIAAIGLLLAAPAPVIGQDQYPERLIKIIVPVQAGSGPDTIARIVADKLQSKWNKPVIVENRPGASGNIGAKAVAQAEPDGYTLLAAPPPPFAINQHLFDKLRYDPAAFVPITIIAEAPNVLVVRPGLGVGSVAELIALARSQPRKLTYGASARAAQCISRRNCCSPVLRSRWSTSRTRVPLSTSMICWAAPSISPLSI